MPLRSSAEEDDRLIWIATQGTRGDIQPFVALGMGLRSAGFRVQLLVNRNSAGLAESAGLECLPCFPDFREAFELSGAADLIAKGDVSSVLGVVRELGGRHLRDDATELSRLVREHQPRLIICSSIAMHLCLMVWRKYRVPLLKVDLQASPFLKTDSTRPSWGLPRLPFGLLRCLLRLILYDTYRYMSRMEDESMLDAEGVAPITDTPWAEFWRTMHGDESSRIRTPTLIAATSLLQSLTPGCSLPGSQTYIGPLIMESLQGAEDGTGEGAALFGDQASHEAIEGFLAAGDPPVYMGWGSMCLPAEATVRKAVGALKRVGRRGIILGGWAGLTAEALARSVAGDGDPDGLVAFAAENVLFVDNVPHEALFPRCCLAVHHGGMGTTAAALRSGRPCVITPVIVDQFDNAELVEKLGVGRSCRQMIRASAEELAGAIEAVATDPTLTEKAGETAKQIRAEDGVATAVDYVKGYYSREVEEGGAERRWVEHMSYLHRARLAGHRRQCLMCAAAGAAAAATVFAVLSRTGHLGRLLPA